MTTLPKKKTSLLSKYQAPHIGALLSVLGFAIMVGGAYFSAFASNSGGSGCLNPAVASSYVTTFTRGTGTISTQNGQALCSAASLVLESMNVPKGWDGRGFDASAVPQTEFAAANVSLPAGQKNVRQTVSVAVPESCNNTQIDFYFPPAYASIVHLHDDDARYIGGVIFGGAGSCSTTHSTPTPTPTPHSSPTPTPTPTPTSSSTPTPTPTGTSTPTPTPGLTHSLACTSLTADVTSGDAPLTVNFTGASTATGESVEASQFIFGDNSEVSTPDQTVSHTYVSPGSYTATLTLKGSAGDQTSVTSACSVSINVGGTTPTPEGNPTGGGSTTSAGILPQTGIAGPLAMLVGAFLVTVGLVHIWLTQRKNLLIVPKKRS